MTTEKIRILFMRVSRDCRSAMPEMGDGREIQFLMRPCCADFFERSAARCSLTTQGKVRLGMTFNKRSGTVEVNTVIKTAGMKSKREEALAFYGITPQTAVIGDCKRVGWVMEATHVGYFFAISL